MTAPGALTCERCSSPYVLPRGLAGMRAAALRVGLIEESTPRPPEERLCRRCLQVWCVDRWGCYHDGEWTTAEEGDARFRRWCRTTKPIAVVPG